jgi:hypothetical protein
MATDTPYKDLVLAVTGTVTIPGHRLSEIGPALAELPLGTTGTVAIGVRAVLDEFLDSTTSPEAAVDVTVTVSGGLAGEREPAQAPDPA